MAKSSVTIENTSNDDKSNNDEKKAVEVDRVGAILYNERLKKNIDLSEISQKLCIRRYYLEAIEKGEYRNLPPMPYSAGFVDSYAKYLGLNNARITQLFREEIDVKPQTIKNMTAEENVAEARLPSKIYVVIGILAVVLLAWAWRFYSPLTDNKAISLVSDAEENVLESADVEYYQTVEKMLEEQEKDASEETKTEDDKDQKDVEKQAPQTEEKVVDEIKSENKSGVEIKITKEKTWLEVKDDKKTYISRTLDVGETYRLPDVKGLVVSAGKYEGVEVYVDGKLTPVFSKNKKIKIDLDSVLENR